jgi:hypothetical protein
MTDGEQQQPWFVREVDDHTGVADNRGIPYTYEHVEEWPEPSAEVYRIVGVVGLVDRPFHKNVYFVEADRLNEFFNDWGEHGEQVVDIQPVSHADAEDEILEFGDSE